MDAAAALDAWNGSADAWFLDGFAPAKNPAMWSDEVLALVARRAHAGAERLVDRAAKLDGEVRDAAPRIQYVRLRKCLRGTRVEA